MVHKHFTLKNKYNSVDRSARIKIENTHRGGKQIQDKLETAAARGVGVSFDATDRVNL